MPLLCWRCYCSLSISLWRAVDRRVRVLASTSTGLQRSASRIKRFTA